MVMGWTEDFLLKTLTSTEKTFFRDEGGQKIPTPLPPHDQKHYIM